MEKETQLTFADLKDGKVKLEFGNQEHIRLIDEKQGAEDQARDNAPIEESDEILKEYEVEYAVSGTAIVTVDAFTEEEAREKASDAKGWSDIEDVDYDFLSLRLIGRVCYAGDC